jgi:hypothetical protein
MNSPKLKSLLLEALDDERKAEATYEAIIERFGPVRPFINIVGAETRHSSAIERQMRRVGMAVPENDWAQRVSPPATVVAACEAGIQGEIENIAMYDRLLLDVDDASVRQTFENLRTASLENHLPAFRRCYRRESRRG